MWLFTESADKVGKEDFKASNKIQTLIQLQSTVEVKLSPSRLEAYLMNASP